MDPESTAQAGILPPRPHGASPTGKTFTTRQHQLIKTIALAAIKSFLLSAEGRAILREALAGAEPLQPRPSNGHQANAPESPPAPPQPPAAPPTPPAPPEGKAEENAPDYGVLNDAIKSATDEAQRAALIEVAMKDQPDAVKLRAATKILAGK